MTANSRRRSNVAISIVFATPNRTMEKTIAVITQEIPSPSAT